MQLEGIHNSPYLDLLRLFAHGIWSVHKGIAIRLPELVPIQVLKLKLPCLPWLRQARYNLLQGGTSDLANWGVIHSLTDLLFGIYAP
uniref:COP9 signalosome complex subunit 7-like isoform X2 n=1 Tax=Nicotiana tabacum TaxID=4097 RepID=A0A1S3X4Y0_TOBAC|nr:PREDICTED: COP9 signalosome complex subunit 7-like isoform X2 [Nicotiana tabacum]